MPDIQDVWSMHEAYKSPPVAIGELVLYKRLKQEGWDIGWVVPSNPKTWKPGDTVGKMINIRIAPRNFGQPMVIEDCVHSGDPLYVYDTTGTRSCYEKVGIESKSVSDMVALYNELLEELKVAKANEGELVKLKAELAQVKQIADNANEASAKASAALNIMSHAAAAKTKAKDNA
jgi:hypothetical protein